MAVVRGDDDDVVADLGLQIRDQLAQGLVLGFERLGHLLRVDRVVVADGVGHLVVDEEQIGDRISPVGLPIPHLSDDIGLVANPGGVVLGRRDVMSSPAAVVDPVGLIEAVDVVLEAGEVVEVGRGLIELVVAVDGLVEADEGELVPVAAGDRRAVAHHRHVPAAQAHEAHLGLVPQSLVQLVGEGGEGEIRRSAALESHGDGIVVTPVVDAGDPVRDGEGPGAQRGMGGRCDAGAASDGGVQIARPFLLETLEVWPAPRPALEHVSPDAVPHDEHEELCRLASGAHGLGQAGAGAVA